MTKLLFTAAAMTAAIAGCKRSEPIPTEHAMVVKVAAGPALARPEPTLGADVAVRRGEVFREVSRQPDFKWRGLFEDQVLSRAGLIEANRRPLERNVFAFAEDFLDANIPTSAWLCAQLGESTTGGASCTDTLQRIAATSNTLVAYQPCWHSECPMMELSGGVVTRTSIPMLSEARVVELGGRPLVLAWTHWAKSVDWTGGQVMVLQLSPPLQVMAELPLYETDARSGQNATYFMGTLTISEDGLQIRGRRSIRDRVTGKESSGTTVDDRWALAPDGGLAKQERDGAP